jgi:Lamin Tail Domain/Secretion system C-terminal sorting domain
MKKFITSLFVALGMAATSQAQIIISEISYNTPESGTDSLEFIEIYNSGASAVDLNGYYITFGGASVRDSFVGSTMLAAGAYLVTAVNDSAVHNQYGMSVYPRQWRSSGLSNSSTSIKLFNASRALVDSVLYTDAAPWPTAADGNGPSLILCNLAADNNLATNWAVSTRNTGNTIFNGSSNITLLGSPGLAESCVANTYPIYTINQINNLNAMGVADSLNVYCEIRAVVNSDDFRGGAGVDFAFINGNNIGITVFSAADVSNYSVMRGDSLHIRGRITQFRGLLQFAPDAIIVANSGNPLVMPMPATMPTEMTENSIIRINNLEIVDTVIADATGATIRFLSGTDTVYVRFDGDTDLLTAMYTADSFNITGVGRQADFNSPFDSNYVVWARNRADVQEIRVVGVNEYQNANYSVLVFPNPAQAAFSIQSEVAIESVTVINTIGQIVENHQNINQNQFQIQTQNLNNGLYLLQIRSASGITTCRVQIAK